jgi:hypothetical protein
VIAIAAIIGALTLGCGANHGDGGSGSSLEAPDGDGGTGGEPSQCPGVEPSVGTACASGSCQGTCTDHESGSGAEGGSAEAGVPEGQAATCGSMDSLPPDDRPDEKAWCCPGPNEAVFPSCHGFDIVGISGVDTASWYSYAPETHQLVEVRHDVNGRSSCWGEPTGAIPRNFYGGFGIPDCPLGSASSLAACAGVPCAEAKEGGSRE